MPILLDNFRIQKAPEISEKILSRYNYALFTIGQITSQTWDPFPKASLQKRLLLNHPNQDLFHHCSDPTYKPPTPFCNVCTWPQFYLWHERWTWAFWWSCTTYIAEVWLDPKAVAYDDATCTRFQILWWGCRLASGMPRLYHLVAHRKSFPPEHFPQNIEWRPLRWKT